MKGHHTPHSEETKLKLSLLNKKRFSSPEEREKLSSYRRGKKMPESAKEKIRQFQKNKIVSLETRKKLSEQKKGSKSVWWKGGITEKNYTKRISIMNSFEYKTWRKSVFERDEYTCQDCKQKGGKLNADHIKPFSLYPKLRFSIDNGRTLCESCHKKTETYGINARYLIGKRSRLKKMVISISNNKK